MFTFEAKYQFLIFATLLVLTSCQFNKSFHNQKYTSLHQKKTEAVNGNEQIISGFNVRTEEHISLELYESSDSLYKEDSLINDSENIALIQNAIATKQTILAYCGEDSYQIIEPYYDSLTNLLCGIYKRINRVNSDSALEIFLNNEACGQINKNCVDIKLAEKVHSNITPYESSIDSNAPGDAIAQSIESGVRIYLVSNKGNYLIQQPIYDSINQTISGNFIEIENARITPNLSLNVKKTVDGFIEDGCLPLEAVSFISIGETDKILTPTERNLKGMYLIASIISGIVTFIFGLIVFGGGKTIADSNLQKLYYLFMVPAFLILCAVFLLCVINVIF
jgi:hypothetical protein